MSVTEVTYRGNLTDEDYWNDLRNFKNADARYTETTDLEGTAERTIYNKRIEMHNPDTPAKIWGCWIEILDRRIEPIYKVISTHPLGDGMFTQTVQQIGETIYSDLEYFCYGDGFKSFNGSRYVHKKVVRMFGVA